jgi:protein SCO1/2
MRLPILILAASLLAGCGTPEQAASGDSTSTAEVMPGSDGFAGVQVPDSPPAPSLALTEHGGQPFSLASQQGKVVLLFFGYTNCPDICPNTMATWVRAKKQLGADTAKVRFVFVTVDPERDTPEVAQRYAKQFDSSFVGLSGTPAQLDSLQQAFRVTSYREPSPAHGGAATSGQDEHAMHGAPYTMVHASRVFVIDAKGRWRLVEPAGASAEVLLGDLRKILGT